jgi:hypothetical protein
VRLVWRRAGRRCEYCRIPQAFDESPFEIDHVIARKHGGLSVAGNLALSCFRCNSFKGPNVGGLDPLTRDLTPLFNPRRDRWNRHFRWKGALLIGRTNVGRATIEVLNMNHVLRIKVRDRLIEDGVFP